MRTTEQSSGAERYLSKTDLAERYGVSTRTVDRWRDDGRFPPADLILPNRGPRWSDRAVDAFERSLVGRRGAAA
jgi:predicted DNA-binding transcriptional regulator AlpA